MVDAAGDSDDEADFTKMDLVRSLHPSDSNRLSLSQIFIVLIIQITGTYESVH